MLLLKSHLHLGAFMSYVRSQPPGRGAGFFLNILAETRFLKISWNSIFHWNSIEICQKLVFMGDFLVQCKLSLKLNLTWLNPVTVMRLYFEQPKKQQSVPFFVKFPHVIVKTRLSLKSSQNWQNSFWKCQNLIFRKNYSSGLFQNTVKNPGLAQFSYPSKGNTK